MTSHKHKCVINQYNEHAEEEKTLEQAATTVFPNKTYISASYSPGTQKKHIFRQTPQINVDPSIDGVRLFISAIPTTNISSPQGEECIKRMTDVWPY